MPIRLADHGPPVPPGPVLSSGPLPTLCSQRDTLYL